MKKQITELEPKTLWNNFYKLTQIPRPSGYCDKVLEHIEEYGKSLGLETKRDNAGNVIIRKEATPGHENAKGIILQGHVDMVPQKNDGCQHDFTKDPIETIIEDGWVRANQTTLGADNGIGIAAAMAVLADDKLIHGPIEFLATVDEETGMTGAIGLKSDELKGEVLLNLDSEEEGIFYTGCAGGLDVTAKFKYTEIETAEDDIAVKIKISGLHGGHSGMDINVGRANANKLLFRFLKYAAANYEAMLSEVHGGDMRNAIPREAFAILTIDKEDKEDFLEAVDEFEDMFRNEFTTTEQALTFTAEIVETPNVVMDEMSADDLINAVHGCPNGVINTSQDIIGLVETSSNLAIINTNKGTTEVKFLVRSLIDTAKDDVASSIESIFRLAGAEVELSGDYPGWKNNPQSQIKTIATNEYKRIFNIEPSIKAIHAGLECGIFSGKYPKIDMLSIGPTIKNPHSPEEAVDIKSVTKFWQLLVATIEMCCNKIK